MPVMAAFCVNSVQKAGQFVKDTQKVHKKFAKMAKNAYNILQPIFVFERKDCSMVSFKKLCAGTLFAATMLGIGGLMPTAEAGKLEDIGSTPLHSR